MKNDRLKAAVIISLVFDLILLNKYQTAIHVLMLARYLKISSICYPKNRLFYVLWIEWYRFTLFPFANNITVDH
ncbi:CLUMA_CG020183, isoform A [Clunio marinus]|uniref:CLUMA_CG020183, isoform A n=1 Tax=Clunio marinus TaxID=568069 RepID=A0A1J1J467_9DIPT|nr:CLUMA_CG020183, isoform A [Clunio marinus]